MNGCHYWDTFMHQNFQNYIKYLPNIDEQKMVESIFEYFRPTSYFEPIERLLIQNPTDQNISYRPRLLFSQLWSLIQNDEDKISILKSQFDDMIDSSGYCEQGWSNRLFQVLFTLDIFSI